LVLELELADSNRVPRLHAGRLQCGRDAQAVELDLSEFAGRHPVEIFGRSRFPRIGELSYLLTLAPRGFYWFQLVEDQQEETAADA